ncbi:O-methyltransferase [Pseudalkalibacillus sp. SCS-8]|uniref:O-methyltransferase n=1 Tax=Pseudalkalibacillus nanhaiensis TaxID=3115291 RepID=UPI0032DA4133
MKVETYIQSLFTPDDKEYGHITNKMIEIGMPTISVSPETGKLLTLLVKMSGAKKMLEIGALGGYSGICLLRGNEEGSLTSLELEEIYAKVAKKHIEEAGFNGRVEMKTGPALQSLKELEKENTEFDFFFIDADKENYVHYLDLCIKLSKPGSIITADNTLWSGEVLNEATTDKDTRALQAYNQKVAEDPRLESLLIPIGDGLTIARVK